MRRIIGILLWMAAAKEERELWNAKRWRVYKFFVELSRTDFNLKMWNHIFFVFFFCITFLFALRTFLQFSFAYFSIFQTVIITWWRNKRCKHRRMSQRNTVRRKCFKGRKIVCSLLSFALFFFLTKRKDENIICIRKPSFLLLILVRFSFMNVDAIVERMQ